MRVDIWSDIVCPFCYIGKKRLEAAAEEADVELEVHWHSFELDPEAPQRQEVSNSERLAQKYGRSLAEVEEMQRNIAEMAKAEGIDFQWENANSGNTFNAHRLVHLADARESARDCGEFAPPLHVHSDAHRQTGCDGERPRTAYRRDARGRGWTRVRAALR